jgi:hypothetical protein
MSMTAERGSGQNIMDRAPAPQGSDATKPKMAEEAAGMKLNWEHTQQILHPGYSAHIYLHPAPGSFLQNAKLRGIEPKASNQKWMAPSDIHPIPPYIPW